MAVAAGVEPDFMFPLIPPFANSAKDPDFLRAEPPTVACAAFDEESRMKFFEPA
jgi:hypothetical protein